MCNRFSLALTVACALAPSIFISAPSSAQSAERLELPSQPLDAALRALGNRTRTNILFDPASVRNLAAPAVTDAANVEEALAKILAGSGLTYRFIDARTVTLIPANTTTLAEKTSLAMPRDSSAERIRLAQAGDASLQGEESAGDQDLDHRQVAGRKGAESPGEVVELEEIVIVTGSRIQNATPTSPVITIGRDQIERGGYRSVQDVFKQLGQNFGSSTPEAGGSNVGQSTQVDLRGLGSKSTLTLVNGRRVAGAGGDRGRSVDISMIPLAAVERVEVLTDGASALYGSDAIGGVANIILRKDFVGAESSVQYSDSSTAADALSVAQVLGTKWASGRVLAAGQYLRSDRLAFHELGIDTLDFRSRGGSDQRIQGAANSSANGTVLPALGIFITPGIPPGTFAASLPTGDGRSLSVSQLGFNQISYGDVGLDDLTPWQEDASGYVLVEQDLGTVTLFADGVYGYRTTLYRQGNTLGGVFVPPGCAPTAATANCNPFSPFAEPVVVLYTDRDFGPVVNDVVRKGWFANLGARGQLHIEDWTWEVLGTRSEDKSEAVTSGQPQPLLLQERLANPDPSLAYNPFGDGTGQSPGVPDALAFPLATVGRTRLTNGSALTQGSLWQMPGGAVRLAMGADYRREELRQELRQVGGVPVPAQLLARGQVAGSRDLKAAFAELYVPLVSATNARSGLQELTFSAAVRYEDYSDFGKTTNPKLGVLWRPVEDLAFRANWGTSFRAPSLIELYAAQFVRTSTPVFDPNAPSGTSSIVLVAHTEGGNPQLEEETAQTRTFGAEYLPRWLPGVRLSLNYFDIDYEDRIRGALDGIGLTTLFQYEAGLPPGVVVRDPVTGVLQSLNVTNINSAQTKVTGYDVMAGYVWETQRLGVFDLNASATFYARYDERLAAPAPAVALEGTVGNVPDRRGKIGLSWMRGPWGAAVSANYIDGFWNAQLAQRPLVLRSVGSQTTVDVQISYTPAAEGSWLQGTTARLGASNLLDERPPFVDGGNKGMDVRNATLAGRAIYLRLSKGFGAAARQHPEAP